MDAIIANPIWPEDALAAMRGFPGPQILDVRKDVAYDPAADSLLGATTPGIRERLPPGQAIWNHTAA